MVGMLLLPHAAGRIWWMRPALVLLLAGCISALSLQAASSGRRSHHAWTRLASLGAAPIQRRPACRLVTRPCPGPLRRPVTLRLRGGGAHVCVASFQWNMQGCERLAKVEVAGTWDDWQTRSPLGYKDGEGWSGKMLLPPGEFEYKYILDDIFWAHDESQPKASTTAGQMNNIITLPCRDDTTASQGSSTYVQTPSKGEESRGRQTARDCQAASSQKQELDTLTDEEKAVILSLQEAAASGAAHRGAGRGPNTSLSSPLLRTLSEEAAAAAAVVEQKHKACAAAAVVAEEEAAALRAVEEAQAAVAAAAAATAAEHLKLEQLEQAEMLAENVKLRALEGTCQWVVAERALQDDPTSPDDLNEGVSPIGDDQDPSPVTLNGGASLVDDSRDAVKSWDGGVAACGEAASGLRVQGEASCEQVPTRNGRREFGGAPSVVTWFSREVRWRSTEVQGKEKSGIPAQTRQDKSLSSQAMLLGSWRLPRASTLIDMFILKPAALIDSWTSRPWGGREESPRALRESQGRGWRAVGAQCLPALAHPDVPFGAALAHRYHRFRERVLRRAGTPPAQGSVYMV